MRQPGKPNDPDFKMPDPAVYGHTMADIAERSGRIVADWLKRMPKEEHDTDPLHIGTAFMEMTAKLRPIPPG
jgi:polyhydroxyalkanoate synthase